MPILRVDVLPYLALAVVLVFILIFVLVTQPPPKDTTKAPGASAESYGSFQPSDSPPKCVPNGTVTYEIYDSAADMRYWVFRWPENGGYSVVPRLTTDSGGRLVPYERPRFEQQEGTSSTSTESKDTASATTGTISIDKPEDGNR